MCRRKNLHNFQMQKTTYTDWCTQNTNHKRCQNSSSSPRQMQNVSRKKEERKTEKLLLKRCLFIQKLLPWISLLNNNKWWNLENIQVNTLEIQKKIKINEKRRKENVWRPYPIYLVCMYMYVHLCPSAHMHTCVQRSKPSIFTFECICIFCMC